MMVGEMVPHHWQPVIFKFFFPFLNRLVIIYGLTCGKDHPGKFLRKSKKIGISGDPTYIQATVDSTNASEESEEGNEELTEDYVKKLDDLENCFEQHKKQQEVQLNECKERCAKNKRKQEEEINKFYDNHAQDMQKLKDEFERQLNEDAQNFKKKLTQIKEEKMRRKQDNPTLKPETNGMNDEPEDDEAKHSCLSYIGKICLDLLANMYHIVLPDQFAEGWLYKIKDIERDIRDEHLLDEQERESASIRWEELKTNLHWDPSLEKTLKMLQKQDGNPMDRTECLTVEKAIRAAEELNKQGRLRGRMSHEKVTEIIEMWRISTNLVQSSTTNK